MNPLFPAAVLATACVAACAPSVSGLLIDNATIVTAGAAPFRADVQIENGRIARIAPALRPSGDAEVINADGLFLTPGLIDSHVHVAHTIGMSDEQGEANPDLFAAYLAQIPRSYLFYGFTTLIDPDLRAPARAQFEAGPLHPHLLSCGRGVRQPGGYGPAFVRAERRYTAFPEYVWDEAFAAELPHDANPAEHTPAAIAARHAAAGDVCLKTYFEAGFGGVFDWPTPSVETLTALREAANANDLTLMLHANGADGWRAAAASGANVIAHGLWQWEGSRSESALTPEADAAIAAAVAAGARVQPTLQVLRGERSTLTWDIISDARLSDALPPAFVAWLRSDEAQWSRRDMEAMYAEVAPRFGVGDLSFGDLINVSIARADASARRFHDLGGVLVFGSDTPAQEGIGNPPGLNGLLEIEAWRDAGIPPQTIFEALTLRNAEAFGLADEIGAVAPGLRGDLLLLRANPLETTDAYNTIEFVLLDGASIARADLSAQAPRE